MCLLSYFPEGVQPDVDALHNGTIFNDDGHGYAIVVPSTRYIIVDRGMDAKEMISTFASLRRLFPDGPALFHSRLATDGVINLLNTHPFTVGSDPRTMLAHNGIMPIRPRKGDIRSDTRIVAEEYIPRAFGTLRRRRARLALERWIGSWNKVVILTVDPRYRDHAFILNEGEGIWDGDVWYSNDMYRGWYPGKYQYTWDDEGLTVIGSRALESARTDHCWDCQKPVDYKIHGECPNCGLCFDCGKGPEYCLCYVPTRRLDHASE